jgi:hypothetical protein
LQGSSPNALGIGQQGQLHRIAGQPAPGQRTQGFIVPGGVCVGLQGNPSCSQPGDGVELVTCLYFAQVDCANVAIAGSYISKRVLMGCRSGVHAPHAAIAPPTPINDPGH